jgi:hypothetical protein
MRPLSVALQKDGRKENIKSFTCGSPLLDSYFKIVALKKYEQFSTGPVLVCVPN